MYRTAVVTAAALALAVLSAAAMTAAAPQVPCYFIFGDSLVDNGNNNFIVSMARANYPPYGIDFAGGPTGRFSNGLTTVDVIAKLLGFDDLVPPFSEASGQQLLRGANFASAAAGIREETGQQLGARISFSGQVQNYQAAVQEVVSILGDDEAAAAAHLGRCVFTVGMGSNDYLNNYFMPALYSTGSRYTPERYADALAEQYAGALRAMYRYGARKVALVGVGQVGCSPNELAQRSSDGVACVELEQINGAVRMFNRRLVGLVDSFNRILPGAHFTYVNVYGIFEDIIKSPGAHGLKVTNAGCCGVGRNNGQVTCLPFQTPCGNRHEYLF
ncbi:GDSL esterase/lipase [Zea mays]|uniref:GDSL esterase/lipase n=2 Tax=Zea mays TaxID=4577 RepID=A0A804Q1N7_MAIZE|nr:GDSL esterase/lipase At4g18970 [Zea mays]PWZ16024.1 GDSL esterase/lipase [Zea mays]|eukprot:XP_008649890.1 GDSL esterase/lipase At4g18970 [Zea mays]